MKLKILLGCFCCSFLAMNAETLPTLLMIWNKDGSRQAVALAEKPLLTFTESELVVKGKEMEMTYALDQMARFTYEEGEVTGVTEIGSEKSNFSLRAGDLYFPSLSAGSRVTVYGMNGAKVLERQAVTAGAYTFSISHLPAGTYLVKANGVTTKLIKK